MRTRALVGLVVLGALTVTAASCSHAASGRSGQPAPLSTAARTTPGTGTTSGTETTPGTTPRTGKVYRLPAQLPRQFAIGVTADLGPGGLGGWVPQSGIPFDYVYQYLAGGVNTSSNWENWNANATFPRIYAGEAAAQHHIPVFPYYMIRQSNPPCTCNDAQADLSHLNDSSVMAAYFSNFRTLMQRLGPGTWDGVKGFGGTAIVQVEPDLSGFAEQAVLENDLCYGNCTGVGNDPSLLRAAVSATGVPEVRSFPNSYLGFNQALLHLRDLYAPNVLLAFHMSPWSTRQDVAGSTSSHVDAAAVGREAGTFAALSGVGVTGGGVSSYDLVFTDVADRDAQLSGVWWDPTNRTFPNFARWEQYVAAAVTDFRKPVFVWQVPVGNMWFDTENGSYGHTQDNRIEYFFAHPTELIGAGIAAVLYGAGNAGSSGPSDSAKDGITNPSATCRVVAGAQRCATHRSLYPDDDGGYLRIQATQYYQHPIPLASAAG